MIIDVHTEGKNHINACSHSSTELGKMLSNFYESPFTHDTLGSFLSVEGFWFYITTGLTHEELRNLSGYEAKAFGEALPRLYPENFANLLYEALYAKLEQNEHIAEAAIANKLPLYHYYTYHLKTGTDPKIDEGIFIKTLRRVITDIELFK